MKRYFGAALLFAVLSTGSAAAAPCQWRTNPGIPPANITFSTYSVYTTGPWTANSGFTVSCDGNSAIATVSLSTGASGTFTNRTMTRVGGTETLQYNLYIDPAATTTIWGNGTGSSVKTYDSQNCQNCQNNAALFPDTIYGRVTIQQDVPPGTYRDTVTATLSSAGATPDNRSIIVQIAVLPECQVNTPFTLDFGGYDPVSANAATPRNSTAIVNVFCTKTTLALVGLNDGSNGVRRMRGTVIGNLLPYEIFLDSGRTVRWDMVNRNSSTSTGRSIPVGNGFTAYGQIAAAQNVSADTYRDTMTVSVEY